MMPAAEQKRRRLQAAFDYANHAFKVDQVDAATVIANLVRDHRATYRPRGDSNRLSCGGASSSCTWSADHGLLQNWLKTAGLRLMMAAMERPR